MGALTLRGSLTPPQTPARREPAQPGPGGAASEAAEGSAGVPACRARRGVYLGALVEVVHGPRAHEGELHVRVRVDAAGQDQLAGGV